jgi:hypothetical protein
MGGIPGPRTAGDPAVTRLAAIAARTVGRRVLLRNGGIGTVTRVTSKGLTVTIPGILPEHIERWLD